MYHMLISAFNFGPIRRGILWTMPPSVALATRTYVYASARVMPPTAAQLLVGEGE